MNGEKFLYGEGIKLQGYSGQEPHPLAYAYIGDAVFELAVRIYLLKQKPRKINQMHQIAIQLVNARKQKEFLEQIIPLLDEEEKGIVRRGRNCKPRHVPANTTGEDYFASTALECLFGYLFLQGRNERLQSLIDYILDGYFRNERE